MVIFNKQSYGEDQINARDASGSVLLLYMLVAPFDGLRNSPFSKTVVSFPAWDLAQASGGLDVKLLRSDLREFSRSPPGEFPTVLGNVPS